MTNKKMVSAEKGKNICLKNLFPNPIKETFFK